MRIARLLGVLAAVVTVVSASPSLLAQGDLSTLTLKSQEPVTVRSHNTTMGDLLPTLGNTVGIEIRVAPEVAALNRHYSFNFDKATFQDVFTSILNAAGLSYSVIDQKTVLVTLTP